MLLKPKTIPTYPGVYIFWKKKLPLYVGKAANLKKRVSSYFKAKTGWKVSELRAEAARLEFIVLKSEIEALIKEAKRRKKSISAVVSEAGEEKLERDIKADIKRNKQSKPVQVR